MCKNLTLVLLFSATFAWAQDACTATKNLGPFPFTASNSQNHISGNHTFINYTRGSCTYSGDGYCDAVARADSVSLMTDTGQLTLGFVHETAVADAGGIATATYPTLAVAAAKGVGGAKECFATCAFTVTLSDSHGSAQFNTTPLWSKENSYANTCPAKKVNVNTCSGTSLPGVPPPINPCGPSPILIDIKKQGFHFTDPAKPGGYVTFRFGGQLKKVSWPDFHYSNAWLVLPKKGVVDSADDMFGNYTSHSNADYTPFPNNTDPNGWLALAFYDQPAQGGNGDGVIDKKDKVWTKLKLWVPTHCHLNPDQPCVALDSELKSLPSAVINSLGLVYSAVEEVDAIGNQCSFVAVVNPDAAQHQKSKDGRVACDFNLANKK